MKQRTEAERVAELEAKIAAIKARGERKKARANPAVRLTVGAVKLLDKALNATTDGVARRTLEEARTALGAFVSTQGWVVPVAGSTAEKPVKQGAKRGRPRKNNTAMAQIGGAQ